MSAEEQQRAARTAWGPWLHDRRWSHVADVTTDRGGESRAQPESVLYGEWRRFHRRLERMAGKAVRFAWAFEENDAGRHIHALVADCESLTVRQIRDAWKAGLATVRVYDPSRGGAFYDVKRVGRATGSESVEVSDALPEKLSAGVLHSAADDADCTADQTTAPPLGKSMERVERGSSTPHRASGRTPNRSPTRSAELFAKWARRLDEWKALGATVSGEKVAAEIVSDIRALDAERGARLLTPAEAAPLTGYHHESIARMVRAGKVPNYGTKHRPRVKLEDLPRKASAAHSPPSSVVGSIAAGTSDSSAASIASSATIARDAVAARIGRG